MIASGSASSSPTSSEKQPSPAPTVELHRHFEAGLRPELIAKLAQKNDVTEVRTRAGVTIEGIDPQDPTSVIAYYRAVERGFSGAGGFARFIDSFGLPLSVLCSLDDLAEASFDQLSHLAAAGSLHTEVRGSPFSYLERIDASLDEIVGAIQAGIDRAWTERGVSGAFIAAFSRQKGLGPVGGLPVARQAPAIADLVARLHTDDRPLGIDIAGFPEDIYPPRLFADALAPVREVGAPLTIHCGEQGTYPEFEASPPALVVEAVNVLDAKRIGHGTCLIQDEAAREMLIERGVGVECCPTSNVKMGFLPSVRAHPLKRFLNDGMLATLATDDPLMFGDFTVRSLLDEHATAMGLTPEDEWKLAENGVKSAFVSDARRAELLQRLGDARSESPLTT